MVFCRTHVLWLKVASRRAPTLPGTGVAPLVLSVIGRVRRNASLAESEQPRVYPGLFSDEAKPWPGGDVMRLQWECGARWARATITLGDFVNPVT